MLLTLKKSTCLPEGYLNEPNPVQLPPPPVRVAPSMKQKLFSSKIDVLKAQIASPKKFLRVERALLYLLRCVSLKPTRQKLRVKC